MSSAFFELSFIATSHLSEPVHTQHGGFGSMGEKFEVS